MVTHKDESNTETPPEEEFSNEDPKVENPPVLTAEEDKILDGIWEEIVEEEEAKREAAKREEIDAEAKVEEG